MVAPNSGVPGGLGSSHRMRPYQGLAPARIYPLARPPRADRYYGLLDTKTALKTAFCDVVSLRSGPNRAPGRLDVVGSAVYQTWFALELMSSRAVLGFGGPLTGLDMQPVCSSSCNTWPWSLTQWKITSVLRRSSGPRSLSRASLNSSCRRGRRARRTTWRTVCGRPRTRSRRSRAGRR